MTLTEANHLLTEVDCRDPDAVGAALIDRARAIAEFASTASQELLKDTLDAGEALRERLEMAQIEARREVDCMTKLSRGLESTLGSVYQSDRITCFG